MSLKCKHFLHFTIELVKLPKTEGKKEEEVLKVEDTQRALVCTQTLAPLTTCPPKSPP